MSSTRCKPIEAICTGTVWCGAVAGHGSEDKGDFLQIYCNKFGETLEIPQKSWYTFLETNTFANFIALYKILK